MERLATFFDRLGHKYKERDLHVLVNTGVLVTAYATLLVVATSAEAEKVRKHYETQACGALVMAMGVKILRVVSAEEFLTVLFTYSKGLMLLLTFAVDQRVFAWTALMTVGSYLLAPQRLAASYPHVQLLTPSTLTDATKSSEKGKAVVVYIYASWHQTCVHKASMFADLAAEYHCDRLSFAMFPIDRWSGMAKDLNVDPHGITSMPTIALFEGGAEVARVPRLLVRGGVVKGAWGKADVVRALELAKYKQGGGAAGAGESSEKKKKR